MLRSRRRAVRGRCPVGVYLGLTTRCAPFIATRGVAIEAYDVVRFVTWPRIALSVPDDGRKGLCHRARAPYREKPAWTSKERASHERECARLLGAPPPFLYPWCWECQSAQSAAGAPPPQGNCKNAGEGLGEDAPREDAHVSPRLWLRILGIVRRARPREQGGHPGNAPSSVLAIALASSSATGRFPTPRPGTRPTRRDGATRDNASRRVSAHMRLRLHQSVMPCLAMGAIPSSALSRCPLAGPGPMSSAGRVCRHLPPPAPICPKPRG